MKLIVFLDVGTVYKWSAFPTLWWNSALIYYPEDGGSMLSRNVGNTAHFHAVPTRSTKSAYTDVKYRPFLVNAGFLV